MDGGWPKQRLWVYTWNMQHLKDPHTEWMRWCEAAQQHCDSGDIKHVTAAWEQGTSGNDHVQAYIETARQCQYQTLNKWLDTRANIAGVKAKDTDLAKNYPGDTSKPGRVLATFSCGAYQRYTKSPGKSADLYANVWTQAANGDPLYKIVEDNISLAANRANGLRLIVQSARYSVAAKVPDQTRRVVHWYWGPSGSGKTTAARQWLSSVSTATVHVRCGAYGNLWLSSMYNPTARGLFFDDVDVAKKNEKVEQVLLNACGSDPFTMDIKGMDEAPLLHEFVAVTSVQHPSRWFHRWHEMRRRIDVIFECKFDGEEAKRPREDVIMRPRLGVEAERQPRDVIDLTLDQPDMKHAEPMSYQPL